MRLLCLHGRGTSAYIFRSQTGMLVLTAAFPLLQSYPQWLTTSTASFRFKLEHDDVTFEFVDAPFPSSPAPDIPLFYPEPYFSFYPEKSIASVHSANEWLQRKLDTDGPYDGLMGFSQGCAVISSYILYHQKNSPQKPLPFKTAIFICGGVPLGVLEDLGVTVPQEMHDLDEKTRVGLATAAAAINSMSSNGESRWVGPNGQTIAQKPDTAKALEADTMFGVDFLNIPKELLIKIPTAHIFGYKDPMYSSSLQLARLCEPRFRKAFDTGGGHEIPRGKEVSETIADLVRWTAGMSGKGAGY